MKKLYLMKGMAVMALGLTAFSCSKKDVFDSGVQQQQKEKEFTTNFQKSVLGGQDIDPNQTWSTTVKTTVEITSEVSGKLRIYTENPFGNASAALLTRNIQAGKYQLSVAKPADVQTLYASLYTSDGAVSVMRMDDNTATFAAPAAVTRSARRAPQAPTAKAWVFADAPTNDDFAYTSAAIPSDALLASQYGDATKDAVHNYKLAETTEAQNVDFYNGNFNLYISGTKTINYTNPGDGARNMKFYMMPGANVTFTQNFTQKGAGNVFMYIPPTATVNFSQGIQAYITLYNRGTVNVSGNSYKPGIYDGGIFYNEGTFNVLGSQAYWFGNRNNENVLTLNNGDSQFINTGTLNAGALTLEGSSHFYNEGTVNISGTTVVNSNQCTWVNDGQYTTGDYLYHAGSTDVINNCKLTVNNLFTINLGDTDKNCFAINAGGGVTTKDFHLSGPGYIKMAANSLFKVTGTARMDATKADYGFWGPTSGTGYAVLQAKDIVTSNTAQAYDVTYGGNLYVASDSHFPNGKSGSYPIIDIIGNAKMIVGQENAPYTIPANGNCSAGYNGTDSPSDPGEKSPTMYYYYAFEDLGTTDDFDFNDVVLRLSAPVDGQSNVELVAAGGTLPAQVTYDGANIGSEVHSVYDVASDVMVNTGRSQWLGAKPLGTITVSNDADMANLPFAITVTGNNGQTMKVERSVENNGKAPLVIVVNGYTAGANAGKWFWPSERTSIVTSYSNFGNWGANVANDADWYQEYNAGTVVTY